MRWHRQHRGSGARAPSNLSMYTKLATAQTDSARLMNLCAHYLPRKILATPVGLLYAAAPWNTAKIG